MVVSEGLVSKITTLLMCYSLGHLFLQYLVDHWAANEQMHLNWIKHNQKAIWADCYQGLVDAVLNNQDPAQVGQHIILPSSHPGSTRSMLQLFQDSMAITHFFGFASYFVTITANPQWPEVQAALEPGQESSIRSCMLSFKTCIRNLSLETPLHVSMSLSFRSMVFLMLIS